MLYGEYLFIEQYCFKILLDQNPRMVMNSSESFPWKPLISIMLLYGQFPLARKTTIIFFSLSAHKYDPEESARPKEQGLNFFPQGASISGTDYQPKALVFLQFLIFLTVKNSSITSCEKRSAFLPGTFPWLSIICIYFVRSAAVEKSPEFPDPAPKKSAILLKGLPLKISSLKPPGITFSMAVVVQVVEDISKQSNTNCTI